MSIVVVVYASVTIRYDQLEGRKPIDWLEYQISDDVTRFIPIYSEADRKRVRQSWKLSWDAPDLLFLED
jgi:hypothetical protein